MRKENFFPMVRGTPYFALMFAPAALTANAQSVTFGSILPFFNISILLGADQHAESNATRTHLEGI